MRAAWGQPFKRRAPWQTPQERRPPTTCSSKVCEVALPARLGMAVAPDARRVRAVGPRLNVTTAWSSNAISICKQIGLTQVAPRSPAGPSLRLRGDALPALGCTD
jgi:hypothetical protein